MQIQYLKTYDANKLNNKLDSSNPRGKSVPEIEALEVEYNKGKHFPKAFREFLFIGGNYNAIGFNTSLGNFKAERDYFDKKIRERGIVISRPYMVFHGNDEGTVSTFIYLDEGDDPQPWNGSLKESYDFEIWNNETDPMKKDVIRTEILWKQPSASFSILVNRLVEHALKGIPPW